MSSPCPPSPFVGLHDALLTGETPTVLAALGDLFRAFPIAVDWFADQIGETPKRLLAAVECGGVRAIDFSSMLAEDDDEGLDELLARHGVGSEAELEQLLDRAQQLEQLDDAMKLVDDEAPRHALALRSYYGLGGLPRGELAQIGRTLGVSSERARQIRVAGEGMLRDHLEG